MNKEQFIQELKNINIIPTNEQLQMLDIYYQELVAYNAHTNLTAITEEKEVYLKHFYDSLTLCMIADLNQVNSLLDIGSGAGFPGIVLKIFFPHLAITLVDSNNKKTKFLEYITNKLQLLNCEIINDRIENISTKRLNSYDIVTARAVTNMTILTELALPLVKKDQCFIAMKGSNTDEINDSLYCIAKMGGNITDELTFSLPNDGGQRHLIKIMKVRESSFNEIRPYNKIIKNPLQKGTK